MYTQTAMFSKEWGHKGAYFQKALPYSFPKNRSDVCSLILSRSISQKYFGFNVCLSVYGESGKL